MKLRIKVTRSGTFKPFKLTTEQYRELGNVMVDSMKKRLARGLNVEGRPTKPLAQSYAKVKAKRLGTSRPKRDLRLTGLTLRDFQVRRAYGGIIRAEPRDPTARMRAQFSQRKELMIGLGLFEQGEVLRAARRILGKRAIEVLWEKV